MCEKNLLESLINNLDEEKYEFLDSVETKINTHISSRGFKECLTFVERGSSGIVLKTWKLEASVDYIRCLTAFCSGSRFKGNDLDSYLTDGVVGIVTKEFESFYEKNSEEIAPTLSQLIIEDKIFLSSLTDQIIECTNSEIPSVIKAKIAGILIHKLDEAFNANIASSAAQVVSLTTTKIVTAAVSMPIAQYAAAIILKYLVVHLKIIITKVLASTAMKTMIASIVKKFAAGALIAGIAKLVGAKLGIGTGAALFWVLIPILAAYITYEAYKLPENLGKKVSSKIRLELSGDFTRINRSILEEAISHITGAGLSGLASDIAQEPEIKEAISTIIKEFNSYTQ